MTQYILQVHDRAQIFISCPSDNYEENPIYVGTVARWSNTSIRLPHIPCTSDNRIYILVHSTVYSSFLARLFCYAVSLSGDRP